MIWPNENAAATNKAKCRELLCLFVSYIISKSYHSRTLWSMKIQGAIKWMNNISWKVDYKCVYHRNGILCVHCFACVSPEKWETTEPNETKQHTLVQKKRWNEINTEWDPRYKPIRSTNLEKYLLVKTEKTPTEWQLTKSR